MRFVLRLTLLLAALGIHSFAPAQAAEIKLVAAENVYGGIAGQIAGDRADVVSVLKNPEQDPHLFETTPSVARAVAGAAIVIVNGAGYDPWIEKLLQAAPRPDRIVVTVADLVGRKPGDNPHLWYDPPTAPAVAKAIAAALSAADPAGKADYVARLQRFLASLPPIQRKIAENGGKYAGTPVTATEPVFGYMASALKLTMRNGAFQRATMNGTEPSARDLAAIESDLKSHRVKVLFYNTQVSDALTQRLLGIARAAHVGIVGVTETQPADLSFQDWMLRELDATERALADQAP